MIAASVQCDADEILKGSHYVRVPTIIGSLTCLFCAGGATHGSEIRRSRVVLRQINQTIQSKVLSFNQIIQTTQGEGPRAGIWQVRGDPRDFLYSKLMCWVALDRAIAMASDLDHGKVGDPGQRVVAVARVTTGNPRAVAVAAIQRSLTPARRPSSTRRTRIRAQISAALVGGPALRRRPASRAWPAGSHASRCPARRARRHAARRG